MNFRSVKRTVLSVSRVDLNEKVKDLQLLQT